MMGFPVGAATLVLSVLWFIPLAAQQPENWPQWRGPDGNGISTASDLPDSWSLQENIIWKTPLPSWSGSTPVIWGDRVFVTSPSEVVDSQPGAADAGEAQQQQDPSDQVPPRRGGRRGGRGFGGRMGGPSSPGGPELLLICLSKKNGSELWRKVLGDGNRSWGKQNSSSPSPVTDGKHVWAMTGNGHLAALDMEGSTVWQLDLQEKYGPFGLNWGYASSPLLYDGKLIIEVLHGMRTDEPSYLVALDAATGQQLWHQERPTDAPRESPDAYTTPVVLQYQGQTQIVVSGGDYVTGHDPQTGEELWRAAGLNPQRASNYRIIASPVVAAGMIYAPTRRRPLLALNAGGSGDVTDSHFAWRYEGQGGPDVPTPVCDGTYLYLVDDSGLVTCLDAKSGQTVWGPERTETGTVSASPLLAHGKLYVTNEQAVTTVLAAGGEFKKIGRGELDGSYTLSSIAVSGPMLFVRTGSHLYCVGR